MEALTPVDILRRGGVDVKLAAIGEKLVEAGHGVRVEADCTLAELDVKNLEMIILPGGLGGVRAIGASKRDISRVFNAETLIEGLIAGLIGIGLTLLLIIPINAIVQHLTGIASLGAVLPPVAAVLLVAISMLLTFIAGLIPSRFAAKKDPVVALRTE